ncbi:lipolytic enzyme, G-D-S-L family [Anaeromyces robustus]|uniref:Lipolytic enzyme, G-D-S-L family n=1 Tax=Anaeromyces robustus TaxID=1754192 RepID=A0A1Y1WUX6_9FUNG|nr:lipolytic enzyme, G-D-S-L family [Anaeromyces robustus]|eukprot:ORX76934.1 lipolytic enzyme, G-D-S-L family [Anaeromyces robustus]
MKFYLISVLCLIFVNTIFAADEVSYTGTWSASQYFNGDLPDIDLQNNTLRQFLRVSIPGEEIRFHFSNLYGKEELELKSVHVAKSGGQGTGKILVDTDTEITFNGKSAVTIPAYSEVISDTLPFAISTFDELAITIYYGKIPEDFTGHAGSRTRSFIELGNAVSKETFTDEHSFVRWYTIAAIDVVDNEKKYEALLCYGDSITDGRGSTNDKQNRWPDVLAEKLQSNPATQHIAVLNGGIGATTLYGESTPKSPTGLGRFEKDVAEQTNVKYMIVLYGVNDILFNGIDAKTLINAYKELIKKAHAIGITIYGSPILPFKTQADYTEEKNEVKETVNAWIKNTPASEGGFDAVIDLASVVADPNDEMVFNPDLCDNDGLHPNYLGHNAMGNVADLSLFMDKEDTEQANVDKKINKKVIVKCKAVKKY